MGLRFARNGWVVPALGYSLFVVLSALQFSMAWGVWPNTVRMEGGHRLTRDGDVRVLRDKEERYTLTLPWDVFPSSSEEGKVVLAKRAYSSPEYVISLEDAPLEEVEDKDLWLLDRLDSSETEAPDNYDFLYAQKFHHNGSLAVQRIYLVDRDGQAMIEQQFLYASPDRAYALKFFYLLEKQLLLEEEIERIKSTFSLANIHV